MEHIVPRQKKLEVNERSELNLLRNICQGVDYAVYCETLHRHQAAPAVVDSKPGKMAVARFGEADDEVDAPRYESNKVMRDVIAPNLSCPSCGYFFKGELLA